MAIETPAQQEKQVVQAAAAAVLSHLKPEAQAQLIRGLRVLQLGVAIYLQQAVAAAVPVLWGLRVQVTPKVVPEVTELLRP